MLWKVPPSFPLQFLNYNLVSYIMSENYILYRVLWILYILIQNMNKTYPHTTCLLNTAPFWNTCHSCLKHELKVSVDNYTFYLQLLLPV